MHGFPFVAGQYLHGPPPAGELAYGIPPSKDGRYAIAVTSAVSGRQVTTTRSGVRLDRKAVQRYARDGKAAARLTGELCAAQATSIELGYAWGVPKLLAGRMTQADQLILGDLDVGSPGVDEKRPS
jgi:hypothetical protein